MPLMTPLELYPLSKDSDFNSGNEPSALVGRIKCIKTGMIRGRNAPIFNLIT